MAKGIELRPTERAQVVALRSIGLSYEAIGNSLNPKRSKQTIAGVIKRAAQ